MATQKVHGRKIAFMCLTLFLCALFYIFPLTEISNVDNQSRHTNWLQGISNLNTWIYESLNPAKQVPIALKNLIDDVEELKGRHSDYIIPPCKTKNYVPSFKTPQRYNFVGPFNYLHNYKNPCWMPQGSKVIKCVPYFYILGVAKAGTTDVFDRILAHPEVVKGRGKEVHFFERERFKKENETQLYTFDGYVDYFKVAAQKIQSIFQIRNDSSEYHNVIVGDGTPSYFFIGNHWPEMPGNEGCVEPRVTTVCQIHHLWPGAKIMLMLRNPITRTFSAYLFFAHVKGFNSTAGQFDAWVKQSIEQWRNCLSQKSDRTCMYSQELYQDLKILSFTASIYSRYILDILKVFPREQIHFVHFESYTQNMTENMRDIYRFLELPQLSEYNMSQVVKMSMKNKGKNYKHLTTMWPSTWKLLEQFFAPYNAELSAILDGDPRWLWKS